MKLFELGEMTASYAPSRGTISSPMLGLVPSFVPPRPSLKTTASKSQRVCFPPMAVIEIHIFRGFAPRAPRLCDGTPPEHSRFSQTTAHTASPAAEISPAQK